MLLLVSFAACQKQGSASTPSKKILVSMSPYRFFVEKIAGNHIEVICLVPPGTNPHLYETPPRLVDESLKSAIWFRLGEPAEKKFVDLFTNRAPSMKIVDLSQGLDLLEECHCHEHAHESADLHIWLSPQLAMQQSVVICEELCALYPQHAPEFRKHLDDLRIELTHLDTELHDYFQKHPTEAILISHPSLGYFCREYHIEQLSLEVEGKEPLPRDLCRLLEEAKAKNIHRVLIQPQHPTKGAERVAEQLDLSVESIDPYSEDYLNNLRQIAHAIGS